MCCYDGCVGKEESRQQGYMTAREARQAGYEDDDEHEQQERRKRWGKDERVCVLVIHGYAKFIAWVGGRPGDRW